MLPRLAAGDFVFTSRFFFRVNEGDLVVIDHPRFGRLVKRVFEVEENQRMLLCGENNASVSPEEMGWVTIEQLLGKVLFCVRQPAKPVIPAPKKSDSPI